MALSDHIIFLIHGFPAPIGSNQSTVLWLLEAFPSTSLPISALQDITLQRVSDTDIFTVMGRHIGWGRLQQLGEHGSQGPNIYYLWVREVLEALILVPSSLEDWRILCTRRGSSLWAGAQPVLMPRPRRVRAGCLGKLLVLWGCYSWVKLWKDQSRVRSQKALSLTLNHGE